MCTTSRPFHHTKARLQTILTCTDIRFCLMYMRSSNILKDSRTRQTMCTTSRSFHHIKACLQTILTRTDIRLCLLYMGSSNIALRRFRDQRSKSSPCFGACFFPNELIKRKKEEKHFRLDRIRLFLLGFAVIRTRELLVFQEMGMVENESVISNDMRSSASRRRNSC